MTLKVKIQKSLTLKTLFPDIAKGFTSQKSRRAIVNEVRNHIKSGKSPVLGKKFKKYNITYAKQQKGGRRSPVDMTLSGDMLQSLGTQSTANKNNYRLLFRQATPADYHNRQGAGKSKVIRRLLPTKNGERFAVGISRLIQKAALASIDQATKKQNR